ncbi:MAG: sensor histidine kinase [Kiritimatiellia bacterium]
MSAFLFCCCLLCSAVGTAVVLPEIDARQVASGEYEHQTVRFRGVVASALRDQVDSRFNWLILRTREGKVCASTMDADYPLDELQRLKDAEIRLTAFVSRYTSWRRFLGYQLTFNKPLGITVLTPSPADPFQAAPLADETEPHRQRVRGIVRAIGDECFFLLTADGKSLPVKPEPSSPMPKVGQTVTAVGFADIDTAYYRLNEAIFRVEPPMTTTPDPVRFVGTDRIIVRHDGQWHLNSDAYGAICRLRGTILRAGNGDGATDRCRTLDVGACVFRIDLANFPAGVLARLDAGCVAEITGLCHADFKSDRASVAFPQFQGLQLIPRTEADIRILRQPPWWTPARLLVVIGILLSVLALLGAWVAALRVVSARRARALAREQIASARAELKVEERTRLAVELHDSLSQTLTGVALQVDAALGVGSFGPAAANFLGTARQMLASCRQELRCCLWDLRSRTFAEKDMTEAVRRTIAPHTGGITAVVRFNVLRESLSEPTTHAILRIVRELVVNAIRHGHATQIRIAGERHGGVISFSVTDNGDGFDPAAMPGPAQGHFGLLGIRERLNALGGTLAVESACGSGARFVITLPSP